MITASDSFSCIDLKDFYAILPSDGSCHERYKKSKNPIFLLNQVSHITRGLIQIFNDRAN